MFFARIRKRSLSQKSAESIEWGVPASAGAEKPRKGDEAAVSKRGVDVSEWNGTLNWEKIRADGVAFAIIRAGYGRYQVDDNVSGALAQGIPVGVYWFSYALDVSYAVQEARKCLETIRGLDVKLPVFYDFEYDTVRYAAEQGVTLGKTEFNDFSKAFLTEIENAGYKPGIYYNLDYYRTMVDQSVVGGYCQWFAQYAASPSITDYAIWQYTSSGTITGLSGRFDLNELADESLLDTPYTGPTGWLSNDKGWWYVREDGSYPVSSWEKIDGVWYYFDEVGYRVESQWTVTGGKAYYLGAGGKMVTDKTLKLGSDGALVPAGDYYDRLSAVPDVYQATLEKLVEKGYLRGTGGAGEEDLKLKMGEDAVRVLVILDRAGAFGE